jgi:tetratricopeptide (TPR) repeat protein
MYQVSAIHRNRGIIRGYAKDSRGAIEDFERAAGLLGELSRRDPGNTNYLVVRADLLARVGTLDHQLGREPAAIQKTSEAQQIMKRLADAPKAPPIQLMTACTWLTETVVVSLRDAKAGLSYCQRAVDATEGKDMEAWNRLAAAQYGVKDYAAATESLGKVLAMMPPAEPGKPKSRQRQSAEELMVKYRRQAGGK